MQKSSWFLKASAAGTLALIMSAAALGGSNADAYATAAATKAATAAATAAAAPTFPACYTAANIVKVRVVHASPNSPAVDVYLDNGKTPAIKALAYGKATDYVEVSKGPHQVTVIPAGQSLSSLVKGTPTASTKIVFDGQFSLKGKNAYTLVAEGTVADKNLIIKPYLDDASDTAGQVRVVVVHAAVNAPAVDVLVDGTPVIQGLQFGAKQELNIPVPAKAVDIEVVAAGTTTPSLISLKGTKLAADTIYTVFATGAVASKTDAAVPVKGLVLTSTSFAGFPAPAVATPAPTAAATMAATMSAASTMAATMAAAAPTMAATVAATTAPTAAVAATTVPKGVKPASAGLAVKTSGTYKLLNGAKCVSINGITIPNGPATAAGLTVGQLILAVNGTPIGTIADWSSVIAKHVSGDVITVTVQDPTTGKESNVPLTLGANQFLG